MLARPRVNRLPLLLLLGLLAAPPIRAQHLPVSDRLRSSDDAVRYQAVREALQVRELPPAALRALIDLLDDRTIGPDPGPGRLPERIDRLAAQALARHPDAARPLLEELLDPRHPEARRWAAARLLATAANADSLPALVRAFDDESVLVRTAAAEAAAGLGPAVVPTMGRLVAEGSAHARDRAIWALGEIGHPDGVRFLLPLIEFSAATSSRRAEEAILKIGPAAAPGLLRVLGDSDPEVRGRALRMFERMAVPGAIPDLILVSRLDPDPERRASALRGLAVNRDPRLAPLFMVAASGGTGDPEVEATARQILREAPPEMARAILSYLDDPAPEVKRLGIAALAASGSRAAMPLAAYALAEGRDRFTRQWAASTFVYLFPQTRLNPPERNLQIRFLLRDWAALASAGPEAAPLLRSGLADPDPEVRAGCAETLGRLALREDIERLARLLDDPHPLPAARAAEALSRFGRPAGNAVMARMHESPWPAASHAAAVARSAGMVAIDLREQVMMAVARQDVAAFADWDTAAHVALVREIYQPPQLPRRLRAARMLVQLMEDNLIVRAPRPPVDPAAARLVVAVRPQDLLDAIGSLPTDAGPEAASLMLIPLVRAETEVREAARRWLVEADPAAAVQIGLACLRHEEHRLQRVGVELLSRAGSGHEATLMQAMHRFPPAKRAELAWVLQSLAYTPSSVPAQIELALAARSPEEIPRIAGLEPRHLAPFLRHSDAEARRQTAQAVTSMRGEAALRLQAELLAHGDAEIRALAREALAAQAEAAAPLLRAMLPIMPFSVRLDLLRLLGRADAVPLDSALLRAAWLGLTGRQADLRELPEAEIRRLAEAVLAERPGEGLHAVFLLRDVAALRHGRIRLRTDLVQDLLGHLTGDDPLERARAAARVADFPEVHEAAPALLARLLGDLRIVPWPHANTVLGQPRTTPAEQAAVALARLGEVGLEPLRAAVGSEAEGTRFMAIHGLSQLAHPAAREDLETIALRIGNLQLRAQALQALGRIRDPASVPLLLRFALAADPYFGPLARRALEGYDAEAIRPHVDALLAQNDDPVISLGLSLLDPIATPDDLPALRRILALRYVPRSRVQAIHIMGRLGTPEAIDLLLDRLPGADASLRYSLMDGLVAAGEPALPRIAARLDGAGPADTEILLALLRRSSGRNFGDDPDAWVRAYPLPESSPP